MWGGEGPIRHAEITWQVSAAEPIVGRRIRKISQAPRPRDGRGTQSRFYESGEEWRRGRGGGPIRYLKKLGSSSHYADCRKDNPATSKFPPLTLTQLKRGCQVCFKWRGVLAVNNTCSAARRTTSFSSLCFARTSPCARKRLLKVVTSARSNRIDESCAPTLATKRLSCSRFLGPNPPPPLPRPLLQGFGCKSTGEEPLFETTIVTTMATTVEVMAAAYVT